VLLIPSDLDTTYACVLKSSSADRLQETTGRQRPTEADVIRSRRIRQNIGLDVDLEAKGSVSVSVSMLDLRICSWSRRFGVV